jgi:hypothetical protein
MIDEKQTYTPTTEGPVQTESTEPMMQIPRRAGRIAAAAAGLAALAAACTPGGRNEGPSLQESLKNPTPATAEATTTTAKPFTITENPLSPEAQKALNNQMDGFAGSLADRIFKISVNNPELTATTTYQRGDETRTVITAQIPSRDNDSDTFLLSADFGKILANGRPAYDTVLHVGVARTTLDGKIKYNLDLLRMLDGSWRTAEQPFIGAPTTQRVTGDVLTGDQSFEKGDFTNLVINGTREVNNAADAA